MTDPPPPPPPNRRSSPLEIAILSTPLLIGIGAGWYYGGEVHDFVGVTAISVTAALGFIVVGILSLAVYAALYTLAVTGHGWVVAVIAIIALGWAFGDYFPPGFVVGVAITAPITAILIEGARKLDAAQRRDLDE